MKSAENTPVPTWDAERCKNEIVTCMSSFSEEKYYHVKKLRQACFFNTCDVVRARRYISESGQEVQLPLTDDIQEHTVFYDETSQTELCAGPALSQDNTSCTVIIEDKDTIDAAYSLMQQTGSVPLVLNMASASRPGGGVYNGAGAQEESLFRRSDYFRSLYQYADFAEQYADCGVVKSNSHKYPLDTHYGAVYSPGVTVFKKKEAEGFALIDNPFHLDFIACAAQHLVYEDDFNEQLTRDKISLIYRIARKTGHRTMVLGALGCGAFHNPPEKVAQLFKTVLADKEFNGCFDRIVFAVLNDHNGAANYQTFKKVFE
jgi:uncharacterized protein (TIGR02452 family)